MKIFDYSELIRVIDNVEVREENEKKKALLNLKEEYEHLEESIIESGMFDDWYRLKKLCAKAKVRLCVSCIAEHSIGIVNGTGSYGYCGEYKDNGEFSITMSSGSYWTDYYGFKYSPETGLLWRTFHLTGSGHFDGFGDNDEKKYRTRLQLLKTFKDTYEEYRDFQLHKVEENFANRIKTEDIIKEDM